jgi:hypothetical protein
MAGFDVHGPQVRGAEGYPVIVEKVTVLRLQLFLFSRESRRKLLIKPQ